MDPPSFLWRGWGLSSQLFAMIFMPIALAYVVRWIQNTDAFENGIGKQFFKELKICLKNILRINRGANLHLARKKELQDNDIRERASLKNSLPNPEIYDYLYAILFITLTTMGHLGLGIMLFLSIPVVAFTKPLFSFLHQSSFKQIWNEYIHACLKTLMVALPPIIMLSYWILPTLIHSAYHNTSFWDPVWKFNSYGVKEVLVNLWNGSLFDWGRLPIFTLLVGIGFFVSLMKRKSNTSYIVRGGNPIEPPQSRIVPNSSFEDDKTGEKNECWEQTKFCAASLPLKDRMHGKNEVGTEDASKFSFATNAYNEQYIYLFPLSFLFLFFLLLYFGNTTWNGLLNIIPSMNEFHQHRFIVGLHLTGLFLAPIGLVWIADMLFQIIPQRKQFHVSYLLSRIFLTCILVLIIPHIYRQTITYANHNTVLVKQAEATYKTQKKDAETLLTTMKTLMTKNSGRVFAGRGGGWGKNFRVAETPYFMYLSSFGISTVLWLPETWSNNSDTEQYFVEENPAHYDLYNIRYIVTPPTQSPQKFWKFISETPSWKLYEVMAATGYITTGSSPSVVFSHKLSYGNVVRLWIQSPYPEKKIFPELILSNKNLASKGDALRSYFQLPQFVMVDEATYKTSDGKTHALFTEQPVYMTPWEWPQAFPKYTLSSADTVTPPYYSISITNQSNDTDMVFTATVKVTKPCPTCVVILKQTYHPNWRVTVNGEPVESINVFPSYVALKLEEPGIYEVVFSYTPSRFKIILMISSGILLGIVGAMFLKHHLQSKYEN